MKNAFLNRQKNGKNLCGAQKKNQETGINNQKDGSPRLLKQPRDDVERISMKIENTIEKITYLWMQDLPDFVERQ